MIWYAILAVAAIVFAAHAEDCVEAVLSAEMLAFNWLICATSYTNPPPASVLWSMDLLIKSEDLWALADVACVGVVCLIAGQRLWGKVLSLLFTGQCATLALYSVEWIEFATCSAILDAGFLLEIGVFLLIGGGGVGDRLCNFLHRLRGLVEPTAAVLFKAAAR